MTLPLSDDAGATVSTVADRLFRRWRRWTELDDIKQELWSEVYATPDHFALEDLPRRLRNAGERYCRSEKARKCGYDVDDEQFYSLRVIRELLPDAIEGDPPVLRGVSESEVKRRGTGTSMEYETSVIDVKTAYFKLGTAQQDLIWRAYVLQDSMAVIAERYGDTENNIGTRAHRALLALQRKLGGRRPQTMGKVEKIG